MTDHRLPHFLIIGAQKSGTTSLYDILASSDAFCLPSDKEPDALHRRTDVAGARAFYHQHFAEAREGQILGEASTMYTMRDWFPDVAGFAKEVCGSDLRLVMIMRDPLARIISHLGHDYLTGRLDSTDFDREVFAHPRFIEISDYAKQLESWVAVFGREQLKCVALEDLKDAPLAVGAEVAAFLGAPDAVLSHGGDASNKAETITAAKSSVVKGFVESELYRSVIRRALPTGVVAGLKKALFGKKAPVEVTLSAESQAKVRERLKDMPARLEALTGFKADWPSMR